MSSGASRGCGGIDTAIATPGREPEALLGEVWDGIYQHLRERLVKSKAGRSVLSNYTYYEACDGIDEKSWYVSDRELGMFFGDAAGLCYMEMYLSKHWVALAVQDLWAELQRLAASRGSEFAPPESSLGATALVDGEFRQVRFEGERELALQAMLQQKAAMVFFSVRGKVASAYQCDDPDDDWEVSQVGESTTLKKLPGAERARVRDLIVRGLCACEPCQILRARLKLPVAPLPARPEKKKKKPPLRKAAPPPPAPHSDLSQAKMHTLLRPADFRGVDPGSIVALNLSTGYASHKVPPSVFAKLPGLPLKALGLSKYRTFNLPEAILSCPSLEVLGLFDTLNSARATLTRRLPELSRLRGIDLGMVRLDGPRGMEALETLANIPTLEIIDGYWYVPQFPPALAGLSRLRHLDLSGKSGLKGLKALPLTSVMAYEPIPCFETLRYYQGPPGSYSGDFRHLEFLATYDDGLPETLRASHKLRGLSLSNVTFLPDWLADIPSLEFLEICNYSSALNFEPSRFQVLQRLPRLKTLILYVQKDWKVAPGVAELNFSGLTSLEWLTMRNWSSNQPFPRGLREAPALRYLQISSDEEQLRPLLPPECKVYRNCNGWDALDSFRAMTATRSDPEWWLSRFRVSEGDLFERFCARFEPDRREP